MNPTEATRSIRLKVGVFTILGVLLIGAITVWVNDRPYWWRPCQLVRISVEDATGLKKNSPVRSLGLEIGFLDSVDLTETHVSLGICITAPVEVLPTTRAYIRGEGFLGDKFVELKPVRYLGGRGNHSSIVIERIHAALGLLLPEASAAEAAPARKSSAGGDREIPVGEGSEDVQKLVNRVDSLVGEITGLTANLKQAINPEELRNTMKQLNKTLENASKTLAPEGGLNQTAQRTLAKLEDAIGQLRDMMTRVNKGEGSIGMLLNDPTYAEEIRQAIRNVNLLLSKVSGYRFIVDIGAEQLFTSDSSNAPYNGGRGWFQLSIWPDPSRYYRLGITVDPRGREVNTTTETTVGTQTVVTKTRQVEERGLNFTAMIGKVFWQRIDLSVGALHGDGALSSTFNFGPTGSEERIQLTNDLYSGRRKGTSFDDRISIVVRPFLTAYLRAGVESIREHAWFYGAGIAFSDDDIKMLFALR